MTNPFKTKTATTVHDLSNEFRGMVTGVQYHATMIVTWSDDGITLDSGGWETVTTKRRMNEVSSHYKLGFHVFQEKHVWYVTHPGGTVEFEDGMTIPRLARAGLGV